MSPLGTERPGWHTDDATFAWFMAHGHDSQRTTTGFRVRVWLDDGRVVSGEASAWGDAVAQARESAR